MTKKRKAYILVCNDPYLSAYGVSTPGGRAGTEIFQYQPVEQVRKVILLSTRKLMIAYLVFMHGKIYQPEYLVGYPIQRPSQSVIPMNHILLKLLDQTFLLIPIKPMW